MNLFPMIPDEMQQEMDAAVGVCKEIAWDFERDIPIFSQGVPVMVTGKEAVRVWAWNALKTVRFRHEIFPWDYGCEIESLIGQPFTDAVKQSEAMRYVRECLLESPYINAVRGIQVSFEEDVLRVECAAETIYGEVDVIV